MSAQDLPALLGPVTAAVRAGGTMVRAEFLRPDGPRGGGHKAPVDDEIERMLQDALRAALPVPFVGEELPPILEGDPAWCWLVDPHDGTSEFLRGARGSSVSVALLREGVPVLGVVHAPLSPDRGSDLIAWAEGLDHLVRNDIPIRPALAARRLDADAVVLLAFRSYARPATNLRRVAPARFMSSNSIAYRLARVAAGDGVATVSRQSKLSAYDYAAGHALLRGAGCVLLDGDGNPPVYGPNGTGGLDKCFAGAPAAVRELLGHDWSMGDPPEPQIPERIALDWPRRDAGLDRAFACLACLAIGESADGTPGPITERAILLARDLIAGRTPSAAPLASLAPFGLCARDAPEEARAYAAAIAAGIAGGTRADMVAAAGGEAMALFAGGAALAEIAGRDPVAGALIGAAEGRAALPEKPLRTLLASRTLARPPECWPDDLPLLAEALLSLKS